MSLDNHYTIINAISDLQARGFILDFSIIRSKLFCAQEQRYHELEEFDVLEMYRFHSTGRSDRPTDVYAIESLTRPLKGILLKSGRWIAPQLPNILTRNAKRSGNGRTLYQ
jgi:hypothetical protein